MDSVNESWRVLGLSVVDCGLCKLLMETWRHSTSSALIILSSLLVGVAGMSVLLNWLSPGGAAWAAHYHTHGRFKRRSMAAPEPVPGPSGWPIIGSLALMGSAAHKNLARLAESYGARRLMAVSLGFTRLMISSEPEVAREILNSSAFADRPVKESAYGLMFHRAIGFAPYGDYWRHLRRIAATHLFSPKRVAAAENNRQIIADSMVDDIRNAVCATGSVKVREIFRRASLNNTLGSVFGRRYDFGAGAAKEARDVAWMVEEGYDLLGKFNWADHLPLLGFFDLQGIRRRCGKLAPVVYDFVLKVIDEHRAVPKNSDSTDCDFVDVLLGLEGDQKLGDQDMVAVLWEMIFRGTDTVAILMEWTLARVVLHLDIQAKLHEELDRVVGRGGKVLDSDIQELHYLQAVVKEVLRMHPPGPLLSWARLAIHDVDVAGHFVPAGTTAMVNMWDITHNKEIWSDPYAFNPDRFLPAQGGEEINIMGCDLRLAPFGSGRRVCPGKALGLATVHLWLARMLHHFEWLPCPHHPVDLSEVLRLSCEMQLPLCVRAIDRTNINVGFQ